MKKLLMGALEELEEVVPSEENPEEEQELEMMMLTIMEDEQELEESADEINGMDELMEEVDASVERLEAIRDAIEKYGISAPMMEMADPQRELVAAGIVGAYEELGTAPVKDENASLAVEGIGDAIKNIAKQSAAFFKKLSNSLKIWGLSVKNSTASYKAAVNKFSKSVGPVDDEKFSKSSLKVYSKQDFNKLFSAVKTIINNINTNNLANITKDIDSWLKGGTFDPKKVEALSKKAGEYVKVFSDSELSKTLGISIELEEDGSIKSATLKKPAITVSKGSASDLGWKGTDVSKTLKDVSKLLDEFTKLTNNIASLSILADQTEDLLIKYISDKRGIVVDKSVIDAWRYGVKSVRKILTANNVMFKCAVSNTFGITSSSLKLANNAIKAKK